MSRSLGATTVTILALLERQRGYGLDIINQTGLLAGTVYTTLRRLERRQQIEGQWEDPDVAAADRRPRRRYYTLTASGKLALDEARERLGSMGFELRAPKPTAGPVDA